MSQRFNRRDFVKYGVLAGVTALAAREAILQTSSRDLARQADGSGVSAFSGGPGGVSDPNSHLRLHTLSEALDHSGAITDIQHGSRGTITDAHSFPDIAGGVNSHTANFELSQAIFRALRLGIGSQNPDASLAHRLRIVEDAVFPDDLTGIAGYVSSLLNVGGSSFGDLPPSSYIMQQIAGTLHLDSDTDPGAIYGLSISPVINSRAGGVSPIGTLYGFQFSGGLSGSIARTLATRTIVRAGFAQTGSGWTVTTTRVFHAQFPATISGSIGTVIGMDVDSIPVGTTRIGIRQSGGTGVTNRVSSPTRFGDQTAPTETLEDAGNFKHEGFVDSPEIVTPATPTANRGRLYFKDSGGISKLFYKQDDGTEIGPLAAAGAGPSGSVILLNADETDASGTTTNASAKTYSLAANTYARIMVEAEISLVGVGNELDQVTFDLKIDGINIDDTVILQQAVTGAGDLWKLAGNVKGSKVQTGAVTVTVSVTVNNGTGTWTVRSLRVYGVT